MKVKEVEQSVSIAWSPADHNPVVLAAGTAAHLVDIGSNSTSNSTLDLYGMNLLESGLDMELKASITTGHKYHKLVWGGGSNPTVVGGCDSGIIDVYNVDKMMSHDEALVTQPDRHTGSVRALDFNPFQTNLLATGACDSEIFIWDLNQMNSPMSPGVKPQPYEDIICLAWNKQVQHILASAFGTRCIVWDLRKNEQIIKLSDSTSRVRWKDLAWHPDIPTQLCLASEDDSNPVIQLWDLRFATSPIRSLQGHTRGVLSLSWCKQDSDLMISSAKDNRILCWNPNSNEATGEVVCEIPNTQQWIFEVSWCPRNPALIASCSCDNHTSIYSLMGSSNDHIPTTNKIADSFPGMEQLNQSELMTGGTQHQPSPGGIELKRAPKWLRQPVGVSFAFGGKFISFGPGSGSGNSVVSLNQISTETQLVERAHRLRKALAEGRLQEVCRGKGGEDPLWRYLEASFDSDPRAAIRELLGFSQKANLNSTGDASTAGQNYDVDGLTENIAALNQDVINSFGGSQNGTSAFDSIQPSEPLKEEKKIVQFRILTDNDVNGNICRSLLLGSIDSAANLCIKEGRMAEAIILSMVAGPEVLAKTQLKYFQESEGYLSHIIEAVITKDWKKVVSYCDLASWKEALVAILTHAKEEELPALCETLGGRLEETGVPDNLTSAEVCYVASGNIGPLIHKRTSNAILTSNSVQDLVELVLVGQCAIGSRDESITNGEEVSRLLHLYADMLASQGQLDMALAYITHLQDESSVDLANRLKCAIGMKHTVAPQQQQLLQMYSRKSSTPGFQSMQPQQPISNQMTGQQQHYPNKHFGGGMGGQPGPIPPPPCNTPPVVGGYGKPLSAQLQQPIMPPQTSQHVRSTPSPLTHGGLSTKKYVVDPSVQGGGSYSARSFDGSQPSPYLQQHPLSGGGYGIGAVSFPAPGVNTFQPPMNSTYQSGWNQQQPQRPPSVPSSVHQQPTLSTTPHPGGQFQQPSSYTMLSGSSSGGIMGQQQVGPPPLTPPTLVPSTSSTQTMNTSAPGWNDPPPISAHPRHQINKPDVVHHNPITHPLFSLSPQQQQTAGGIGLPPPNQATLPCSVGPGKQIPSFGSFQPPPSIQESLGALQPTIFSSTPHQMDNMNGGGYKTVGDEQRVAVGRHVEPPGPKAPLPQQYAHLQKVFDELRLRCTSTANNPQLKKKLEDVSKKLEALYDALRESRLSPSTISGLEQLVTTLENGDYTGALSQYTQMVSGPDFAQIASFMPGLKMLVQSALQLGVYLH